MYCISNTNTLIECNMDQWHATQPIQVYIDYRTISKREHSCLILKIAFSSMNSIELAWNKEKNSQILISIHVYWNFLKLDQLKFPPQKFNFSILVVFSFVGVSEYFNKHISFTHSLTNSWVFGVYDLLNLCF